MSAQLPVLDTKVLAIASHVVYGYVGNTMATFVMQALGCEVSALNTVHFSNHTGYKQVKGTKATAQEILDIYRGLQQSNLTDFDFLLSGYAPGAEAVNAIGSIVKDLRSRSESLFWVMDPVMGDNGQLYVNQDVVPAYKSLLFYADLILPNQFEAETLSGASISDLPSLKTAISTLHRTYHVPHIIVTSVRFPLDPSASSTGTPGSPTLSIVGSTARSDHTPRLFRITVSDIDVFFSGTGDMFAALTVARFREAAATAGLSATKSWVSGDSVEPLDLPLARAIEKVCASMQVVLEKTKRDMEKELEEAKRNDRGEVDEKKSYLLKTKASEVRIVKYQEDLRKVEVVYKAEEI
ncbi:putative pyridoxal kinase [Thelotrema lepadinum]|nr:putative pyridoxal kinase [Thelotrema lepadinum]